MKRRLLVWAQLDTRTISDSLAPQRSVGRGPGRGDSELKTSSPRPSPPASLGREGDNRVRDDHNPLPILVRVRSCALLVLAAGLGILFLTSGCKNLFPKGSETTESRWQSYAEVQAVFEKVTPNVTTTNELKELGLDPNSSPNMKVLNYVDIIQRFMLNPAINMRDLDEPVRACIEAKQQSYAYELTLNNLKSKRHGNLFLDVFGFKRQTNEKGWSFHGLILLTNHVVVYKIVSGEPEILREQKRIRPLGPLQELDSATVGVVKALK